MQIKMWKFYKEIRSTLRPTDNIANTPKTINAVFKDTTNITRPVLKVINDGLFSIDNDMFYNYVQIGTRYYFATINIVSATVIEMSCTLDPLATFRDDMHGREFFIERASSATLLDNDNENLFLADELAKVNPQIYDATQLNGTPSCDFTFQSEQSVTAFYVIGVIAPEVDETQTIYPVCTRGAVSYFVMFPDQFEFFIDALDEISQPSTLFTQQVNAMDFIKTCVYIPLDFPLTYFERKVITTKYMGREFTFGYCRFYGSAGNKQGYAVRGNIDITFAFPPYVVQGISLPYMLYEPYTFYRLAFGPFGVIDIPAKMVVDNANFTDFKLKARLYVDLPTGDGTLVIMPANAGSNYTHAMYVNAKVGADIQIAQITNKGLQGTLNAVSSLLSTAGSLASGNALGAVSGLLNTSNGVISSLAPVVNSNGASNDSFIKYVTEIFPMTEAHWVWTPDRFTEGFPVMEKKILYLYSSGDYDANTGYIKTRNARCWGIPATHEEIEMLESYMDEGFMWTHT